jgi:hypothetical protein
LEIWTSNFAGDTSTHDLPDKSSGRTITKLQTTQFYLVPGAMDVVGRLSDPIGVLKVDRCKPTVCRIANWQICEDGRHQRAGDTCEMDRKNPVARPGRWDVHSEYHLDRFAEGFTADTVDIRATLHNGMLRIDPLLAKRGDGTLTTTASFDLKHPRPSDHRDHHQAVALRTYPSDGDNGRVLSSLQSGRGPQSNGRNRRYRINDGHHRSAAELRRNLPMPI